MGIRTIKTYGGKEIEVEDLFAVFCIDEDNELQFLNLAADELDAQTMCDQAIINGEETCFYFKAVSKGR